MSGCMLIVIVCVPVYDAINFEKFSLAFLSSRFATQPKKSGKNINILKEGSNEKLGISEIN